jgi:hypothetical protein
MTTETDPPVPFLFYPSEPCARCARTCWTACQVCREPFCLTCVYDHHGCAEVGGGGA